MSDHFGCLYLLIGHRHAPLLAVSIHSLRAHYSGPVAILAGDDAAERYARAIAADERAGDVRVIRWEHRGGERGSVYLAKTRMYELSPFERSVFLDADTLIAGDFSALCPAGDEVRLTRFADWRSDGRRMRGRLLGWKDVASLLVARAVSHPYPAINTGAIGFGRGARRFFAAWSDLCGRRVSFICDELSCQLIYPDFPHQVMGDELNWCPIHSKTPVEQAKVIHFHGGNAKLFNRTEYRRLWLPAFERTARENFGGLADWVGDIDEQLKTISKQPQPT